jgi:tetratricopeptide (TPR) repeat protein
MKSKFYLGAAAAVIALAGVGLELTRNGEGVPFIDPMIIASAICGDNAMQQRQAFFLKLARAYAEGAPATPVASAAAPQQVGTIAYKITTSSPAAQAHFNMGLAYMWNFNHGAAIESFKAAQAADPQCAMCFWGESLALGPNINLPMADEAVAPAFAAVKKAISLKGNGNAKEQALITALGYRYQQKPVADRSKLDAAFADQMDKVALQFPDDDFIATLAAEANMDTQPWDYWQADKRTEKGRTSRTLSLIEGVLARNPDHQAAIHLYIHVTENTRDPYRAVKYADKLAALSPGLGHLIHMPAHTYFKIGRFKESLDLNVVAAKADEAFFAANSNPSPMYKYGYYTHNVHFVMTSAQMSGDGPTALAMADKLDTALPKEMAIAVPFSQPIKAAPLYARAQYADPAAILALEDPGAELPFLQGAWRYARGEAYAKQGDAAKARAEADAIAELLAKADLKTVEQFNIPATSILKIERLTVLARAAAVEGDHDEAVEAMEEVVALQEGLNYTEPPYWYYPAKQTLAAMVLRQGDAERAEQLFIEALAEAPNNGWVLYGLSEAYKAQKDKAGSKYASGLFKNAWAGDGKAVTLAKL